MRNWFESLEKREQLFVAAGAVIVVIAVAWGLVWAPFATRYDARIESVATWQESVAALGPLAARGPVTRSDSRRPQRGLTPVVVVDQTLRSRGLDGALKRSQPISGNGIRVDFENVAFDDLVVWLGDLGAQYDMHVAAGSFSSAGRSEPGRINATLTLERSP